MNFFYKSRLDLITSIIKLPLQQSASEGKCDGQLSLPQMRLPLQSLLSSQSPWLRPHWLDDEQQSYTSSLISPMELHILAEKSNHI